MEKVFSTILNMSYQASIVIVFIILARILLKVLKAPKKYVYYLWGIAFVRMICPFEIEHRLSLLPENVEPISKTIVYEQVPKVNTGWETMDYTVNSILPPAQTTESVNPMQIWMLLAQTVWVIGIVLIILYSTISYVKLRHQLVGSVRLENNIYLVDYIKTPFVLGMIRPRIYLPSNIKEEEANYILQHEKFHIKRKDPIIKMLAFLITIFHWFNPLAWIAFIVACKDMEMSCDEYVIKTYNKDIRKEYSESLLSFATGYRQMFGTPLAFGEGNTKGRIKNVMKYKKPAKIIGVVSVVIGLVLAIGLLTNPDKVSKNNRKFKEAILNIKQEEVELNKIVPFEWTEVYTFDPYLPTEYQENIMGLKSNRLRASVNEGMVHLVFVNGKEVVSNICAYPDYLGYSVDLRGTGVDWKPLNTDYHRITFEEDAVFHVKRTKDRITLNYISSRNLEEEKALDEVLDEVTMEFKEGSLSPEGVTIILSNPTKKNIECGSDYYLEKYMDDTWEALPYIIDNAAFTSEGYSIHKDEPREMVIHWEWLYGKLSKGRYRLCKEIMDFRGTGDYDTYLLIVEFDIKQ